MATCLTKFQVNTKKGHTVLSKKKKGHTDMLDLLIK